jgi:hypothetical protein
MSLVGAQSPLRVKVPVNWNAKSQVAVDKQNFEHSTPHLAPLPSTMTFGPLTDIPHLLEEFASATFVVSYDELVGFSSEDERGSTILPSENS